MITLSKLYGEVMAVDALTRSVVEDLFKQRVSIMKLIHEEDVFERDILNKVEPDAVEIILKITRLSEAYHDTIWNFCCEIYEGNMTISEAIDYLEKEQQQSLSPFMFINFWFPFSK
ncbi:hypothetical protein [Metabacillus litoralis]|uniref:hypothetical protein n=1 Tax=Metabacillus litoralis TaxID=152268 RepID=UPI0020419D0D|nr:hypothetical protein [Metabacillus litoralis]MCM3653466.1 hypothetical protein [Metabacillus litoralis]